MNEVVLIKEKCKIIEKIKNGEYITNLLKNGVLEN